MLFGHEADFTGEDSGRVKIMKVLIVPMAAMAETAGPSLRCHLLAEGFIDAGFEVATCMAEDMNYKAMEGISNYYLDVPMPFGLPKAIASRTFPVAGKLGITSKKTVHSFDEVLWFTGNLDYRYLKKSTESIRKAIRAFHPDIVYSEFNVSAIIAAKKEGITLCVTLSYPTRHEYAHRTRLADGLNRLLGELQLPSVDSALQLFDWADMSFCPSIRELEPIEKPNVTYCGPLKPVKQVPSPTSDRNKILVYVGNGTISASKALKVIRNAFSEWDYEVFFASASLKEGTLGNVHIARRWDFDSLLNESVLFINHGGQNSVMDGLLHGVPQILIPGKVFERRYNARCIEENKAGVVIEHQAFDPERLRTIAERTIYSKEMTDNAVDLGNKLRKAGGIKTVIRKIAE